MLESSDDAATVNWGDSWRMPTRAEQEELNSKCTWTWTTRNGIKGYKVVGLNGNSIFLPAAGFREGRGGYSSGAGGYYMLASLYENNSYNAWGIGFSSHYHYSGYSSNRYSGSSVRAVAR